MVDRGPSRSFVIDNHFVSASKSRQRYLDRVLQDVGFWRDPQLNICYDIDYAVQLVHTSSPVSWPRSIGRQISGAYHAFLCHRNQGKQSRPKFVHRQLCTTKR
jgi:hypothetical protein